MVHRWQRRFMDERKRPYKPRFAEVPSRESARSYVKTSISFLDDSRDVAHEKRARVVTNERQMIFHPVDTVAKRLMNNKTKIGMNANALRAVVMQNATGSFVKNLYAGVSAGFVYKVSQRTYKYGGQSYLNETLSGTYGMSKLVRPRDPPTKEIPFATSRRPPNLVSVGVSIALRMFDRHG